MTGFSVLRHVFGKRADKELTAFLLHFWDSNHDQQGLSWDQHCPEWGSEALELEWAGVVLGVVEITHPVGRRRSSFCSRSFPSPGRDFSPWYRVTVQKTKLNLKLGFTFMVHKEIMENVMFLPGTNGERTEPFI